MNFQHHVDQIRLTTEALRREPIDPIALLEEVRIAREQAARARAAIEDLQRTLTDIVAHQPDGQRFLPRLRIPGRSGVGRESRRA